MARIQRETDDAAAKDAIIAGLRAYNEARVGERNPEPLVLGLRDDDGAIVGGLIGEISWEWLHVQFLWIDDAHRGAGHGAALMAMAEKAAREHGARGVYLATMSLQAPDFYPKLGYVQYGVLEDYPVAGERIHQFAKAL